MTGTRLASAERTGAVGLIASSSPGTDGARTRSRVRRWATSAAGPPRTAEKDGEGNRAPRRVTIGGKTTANGARRDAANRVEAETAIDDETRTTTGAGEGTGAGTGAETGAETRTGTGMTVTVTGTVTGTGTGTGTGTERRTANASAVAVGIGIGRRIAGAIGVEAEAAMLLGGTAGTTVGERTRRRGRAGLTRRANPAGWRFANRRETRRGRTSTTIRAGVVIDRGGRRRPRRRVVARKSGASPREDRASSALA